METQSRGWKIQQAWKHGALSWKLRDYQLELYSAISASPHLKQLVKCSRRFGKTFTVLLYCVETAIAKPGSRIRYAAPTEKSLRTYVKPNMRVILSDAPKELRPKWNQQDSCYVWPNGSELYLAGTDNEHSEKLRGPSTDLGICDEAGSMDNLSYIVNDILLPSTIDCEGRILVISSPAKSPDHDFTRMCDEARADGALIIKTVNDNAWLQSKPQLLQRYIKASGGANSSTWRREYLCEDVVDEQIAIIPEATETALARIVVDWPRPKYFRPVESLDPGFSPSNCGCLFGYYDFRAAKLVVEDELELVKMRTDILADGIKGKEKALWGDIKVPHRWSDIDAILLSDLGSLHGLHYRPTSKDTLDAMVNQVRIWVQEDRLRIHPRCTSLIAQLKSGIFNRARTEFAYSTRFGHYDLLAALVYMVRNAPVHENPYPAFPDEVKPETHWIHPQPKGSQTARAIHNALIRR